jgi:heterodisulfide reductase subunit A-like polyferredoxin
MRFDKSKSIIFSDTPSQLSTFAATMVNANKEEYQMGEPSPVAIEIDQSYCSKCSICYSICPFKAITRNSDTGEVKVELQKCQVCGICYSACPVDAVKIVYYDYSSLLKRASQLAHAWTLIHVLLYCHMPQKNLWNS